MKNLLFYFTLVLALGAARTGLASSEAKELKGTAQAVSKLQGKQLALWYKEVIKNGDLDALQKLLQSGITVNSSVICDSFTLLMDAARRQCTPVVEYLIQAGADVRAVDTHGRNALMYALSQNRGILWSQYYAAGDPWDIIKCLLKSGIDVNVADSEGMTALGVATGNFDSDLLELLLDAQADPHKTFKNDDMSKACRAIDYLLFWYADNEEILQDETSDEASEVFFESLRRMLLHFYYRKITVEDKKNIEKVLLALCDNEDLFEELLAVERDRLIKKQKGTLDLYSQRRREIGQKFAIKKSDFTAYPWRFTSGITPRISRINWPALWKEQNEQ